jgi:hypothetical protein
LISAYCKTQYWSWHQEFNFSLFGHLIQAAESGNNPLSGLPLFPTVFDKLEILVRTWLTRANMAQLNEGTIIMPQ